MSDTENKKTTSKQKVLMVLITVVLLVLAAQMISTGTDTQPDFPTDRESCLEAGYIWSQSAETCYDSAAA